MAEVLSGCAVRAAIQMEKASLDQCPFCGCPGQKFKDFWDSGEIDCFGCKDCGISFERAEEWNRRATPTR
jgi:hypothetical protein